MKRGIISVTNNELILLQNLAQAHEKLQLLAKRLESSEASNGGHSAHQAGADMSESTLIQLSSEEAEAILDSLGIADTEDEKSLRSKLLAVLHS